MIRAKFYASSLELLPGQGAGIKVNLLAVCRGDRNSQWATATPSGDAHFTIQNPSAVAWWEDFMNAARRTGRQPEVYLDVTPSVDGWPGDGHAFRPSEGNEGTIYGPSYCGECGLSKDQKLGEHRDGKYVETGLSHPNG